MPLKLLLLTRSLGYGGTERQVVTLARSLLERGHRVQVVTFYGGPLETELHEAGVPFRSLEKRGRWEIVGFLRRWVMLLRNAQPEVIYSFLPVPNIVALAACLISADTKIVWGLRASDLALSHYGWLERWSHRAEDLLASGADRIVANSRAGMQHAISNRGFPAERTVLVQNGIDTRKFAPSRGQRRRFRRQLDMGEDEILIGRVGRLDPMKDYPSFLTAAAEVARAVPQSMFLCMGASPDPKYRAELMALCRDLGLVNRVKWSGPRTDMSAVYSALDLLCSSSAYGEGFPNVIGEAMACGVPCVVTDVGDSACIVGGTGRVVEPKRPAALSSAMQAVVCGDRESMSSKARQRIRGCFGVDRMVERTLGVLEKVARAPSPVPSRSRSRN